MGQTAAGTLGPLAALLPGGSGSGVELDPADKLSTTAAAAAV